MCRICLIVMDGVGEDQVVAMTEHVEVEELVEGEALYGGLFGPCIQVEVSVQCLILMAMRASVIC